jgi:hypothetical protein
MAQVSRVLADGAVTSAKILDGTIATADLADSSVTSAKILDGTVAIADLASSAKVTSGRAVGTGTYTALTATLQDVPSCTVTFTPATAGFAIVTINCDLEGAASQFCYGKLVVDGTAQSESAQTVGAGRTTTSQTYRVSLTAASHTLKVQAAQSGGTQAIYHTNTTLTYTFIPS